MAQTREIPVYLFTGFLDAGKTTFIQETLEDPQFNDGQKTLILLCEEGETELSPITIIQTSGAAMHGGRNRRSLLMILCMSTTTGIFSK